MENVEKKKLYFIYSQYGEKSNIGKLERNEYVEEIQKLHTEKAENIVYIIYSLAINKNFKGSSLKITLFDIKGDSYYAIIDNIRTQPENFIFIINFNPKNSINNLFQFTMPINEQVSIFIKLDNYTKTLSQKYKTYLCSNAFDAISGKNGNVINEKQKCPPELLINIFINSYFVQQENPNDEIIKEFFSSLNTKLIESIKVSLNENSKNSFLDNSKLKDMNLDEFKNVLDIQKNLQSLTGNDEDLNKKIDIVLAIFYYFYGIQFYIKFATYLNPRFDNVLKNLTENRIIFDNFSDEISHDLIFEAEDLNQIDSLLKYIPDMATLVKLLVNEEIFMKLSFLCQIEKKVINLAKYTPPKADDDIISIRNNSLSIIQKCRREGMIHVLFSEDFFKQYFNLFNEKDLHNLQLIKDIYKSFNGLIRNSYRLDGKLNEVYHETGLYLINNGKLFNQDIIDFINNDPEISYMKKDEIENFSKGFDLAKSDPKFLNNFLSGKDDEDDENDKKNLRKLLGNNYSKFLGKIFDKLKTLKDYLCLVNWKMDNNTTKEEVINVCFKKFKEVWIREKTNNLYGLEEFVSKLFCRGAQKMKNFIDELEDLNHSKITLKVLLKVYSNIIKEYYLPNQCREYIRDFIQKNSDDGPLGLWYKTTCKDKSDRLLFLESNIRSDFAVIVEDFIHYPLTVEDRIRLFINLYKDGFLQYPVIQEMEYYRISTSSVDNLEKLKYNDAVIMLKNIEYFQSLFLFFVQRRNQQESIMIIDNILIEFSEKCYSLQPKFETLKSILKYLNKFYPLTEKKKIDNLKKDISTFENNRIENFNIFEKIYGEYNSLEKDAELGGELMNSMFFMEIYTKFGKVDEKEHFDYSLKKFNELNKLCFDDIDSLDKETITTLTECIYKKKIRIKDELLYLKKYFEQASLKVNFSKEKIKKITDQFKKLVQKYIEENGIQDDNPFGIEDIEIEEKENKETKLEVNDDNNFSIFNNNDEDEKEKNKLLNDIHKITNECLNIFKTKSKIDEYVKKFKGYFNQIFDWNYSLSTLKGKEFEKEIISPMKKIYILGVNEIKNEEENNNNLNADLCVINEFYEIFEAFAEFNIEKFLKVLQTFEEYKQDPEENENYCLVIVNKIQNLFELIKDDVVSNSLINLFINLCIQEHYRYYNRKGDLDKKIIENIFDPNNRFIYNNKLLMEKIIPLLHIIFNEDFVGCLKKGEERNNDISSFNNNLIEKINNKCSDKYFEERLLYYFESIITRFIEASYVEEKRFYRNIQKYLEDSLKYLETGYKNYSKYRDISKLYCLAFLKVFLNKFIDDLINTKDIIIRDIIISLLRGSNSNEFRTCLKLYVLKLFYYSQENYIDYAQLNINNKYGIDFLDNEDIKKIKGDSDSDIVQNNMHGFEYYFLPIVNKKKEKDINDYINIFKFIKNIIIYNEVNSDEEDLLKEIKEKDSDIFYCVLVNLCFSQYYNEKFFDCENYSNLQKWITEKIFEESLFDEEKEDGKTKLFEIFFNKDKYKEKILTKNADNVLSVLNYNQLLSVLIAFRFVLYTLSLKKNNDYENKIFYKLIYNPDDDVKKICQYFFIDNQQFNDAKYITKKIIRFIILSHLYFSYLLGKISVEEVNHLISQENDSILNTLSDELSSIQKILKFKGVRNIIIYMNYIFIKLKDKLKEDNNIKKIEIAFDRVIDKSLYKYEKNYEKYMELIEILEEKSLNKDESQNNENKHSEYISFIFENSDFINEKNIEKKYPFITYLTLTNFCTLDDFKKQFYYFTNSHEEYPLINYLLSTDEKNELNIIEYLPVINQFYNSIFNRLSLKITSDDSKKEISKYIDDEELYSKFNQKIEGINNYLDEKIKINKITPQTHLKDIINLKDNPIFELYNKIITTYNSFLLKAKIFEDNNWVDSVIIQNCTKKDYFNFPENKTKMLEKLKDILCVYSERHRIKDEKINVYNGGKIEYDFEDIEDLLQKEFLFGKKFFKTSQIQFIFLDKIYSNENNNLFKELKIKYPQVELNDDIANQDINKNIDSLNEEKDIKNIYANMQYMIVYLASENNERYDAKKISLHFIASVLEKNNYEIDNTLKNMLNKYSESLFIEHILFLHEKFEIKYFNEFNDEIKKKLKINIRGENTAKISEYFKQKNLLITEEIMKNTFKKYILRYYLGNFSNDNAVFNIDNIENIFKKDDLFSNIITEDERFKKEVSELVKLNQNKEQNYAVQYCFKNIFQNKNMDIETDGSENNENDEGEDEEKEEEDKQKDKGRKKKKKKNKQKNQ